MGGPTQELHSLYLPIIASHITFAVIKVIVACNNELLLFIASSCNYRNTSAMVLMSFQLTASISIILQKRHLSLHMYI